jgi:hypothetical protein
MTKKDIDNIISIICPNDEDFEKPIISPAYLKKELEVLALEQEPKWIPCSKRLPKEIGDYLVTTHNGQIARYVYMGNGTSKEYWMRCAVAWMPLPEPYKEEQDG